MLSTGSSRLRHKGQARAQSPPLMVSLSNPFTHSISIDQVLMGRRLRGGKSEGRIPKSPFHTNPERRFVFHCLLGENPLVRTYECYVELRDAYSTPKTDSV